MPKSVVLETIARTSPEKIESYFYVPGDGHYLFLKPGWICSKGECGAIHGATVAETLRLYRRVEEYQEDALFLQWCNNGGAMQPNECKRNRKRLGLTQKQAAELLNTPLKTYQKWEQGTAIPTASAAELMAMVMWLHNKNLLPEYLESR